MINVRLAVLPLNAVPLVATRPGRRVLRRVHFKSCVHHRIRQLPRTLKRLHFKRALGVLELRLVDVDGVVSTVAPA